MKKIIFSLFAVALMGMVACSKDDDSSAPDPDPEPVPAPVPPQDWPDQEGVYSPWAQIVTVTNDGTVEERWSWLGPRLQSVSNGSNVQQRGFSYDGSGRVQSVNIAGGVLTEYLGNLLTGTAEVSYTGDYVSGITLKRDGTDMVAAQVSRNAANKVSRASVSLNDETLLALLNGMIASFVSSSSANLPAFTITGSNGSLDFTWVGDNVEQVRLAVSINASSTKGAIMNSSLANIIGSQPSLSALISFLPDNTPIAFGVTITDTIGYDYDSKTNPFKHYLGQVDVSTLSANNVTQESHASGVSIKVGLTSPNIPLYSRPLFNRTVSYRYAYNTANYPVSVTDRVTDASGNVSNGTTRQFEYTYQEQQQ